MNYRIGFNITLLVVAFALSLASCTPRDDTNDRLMELGNQFVEATEVSGLAVSVSFVDGAAWSKGFGFADVEQMVSVDPALTKFRVGSTAKSMTAMALGMLYEAGKLDLDVPIQTYLPAFPEKSGEITARMLAGHTAGIRHYAGEEEFLSAEPYSSVIDALSIFSSDPVLFEPGTKFSYSTYGYNLLSAVLERAAGVEYLTLMSQSVFDPIGMSSTVPDHVVPIIKNRSRYYSLDDGELINAPWVDNSNKWAGGGLLSTSDDLVRFGLAHLADKFLSRETIEMMWTSLTTSTGEETGYGIGWSIEADTEGRRLIRHSGGSVGGITELRIYPDQGFVVAIITNTSPADLKPLANDLVSVFLNGE